MNYLALGEITTADNIAAWIIVIIGVFVYGYYFKNPNRKKKK